MAWSAFSFNAASGLRCLWCFGNLNNGGNGGSACANGNNTPGNANWNERPRLSSAASFLLVTQGRITCLICHKVLREKID